MIKKIDQLDYDIMNLLRMNGRITIRQIATTLDRRRATIHSRISRLEAEKIIKGYTIVPDYVALDRPITAFILASVLQDVYENISSFETIGEEIARLPEVYEVYSTSGEFDYLIKVRVENLEDIGKNIIFKLRKELSIGRTLTLSVFHSSMEELSVKEYV